MELLSVYSGSASYAQINVYGHFFPAGTSIGDSQSKIQKKGKIVI